MPSHAFVLLRAKLERPRIGHSVVRRPRLFASLDAGLASNLTLVSAPAGFGKTTLVAGWLEQYQGPAAWLSIDVHDNQIGGFLADLVGAIRTAIPGACRDVGLALQMPQPLPTEFLASILSNDLDELHAR